MINTLKQPALIALTTMIVVGAVGLLIVTFVLISGVDILQQGHYEAEYAETLAGAEACADEALVLVSNGTLTAGGSAGPLTIGSITCNATAVSGGGSILEVELTANQGTTFYSRIQVTVDTSTAPISITNWEEVSSF
jgi:hypothetical protein